MKINKYTSIYLISMHHEVIELNVYYLVSQLWNDVSKNIGELSFVIYQS